MKRRALVFKCFLAVLSLAFFAGCGTTGERKKKKELSNLRVHVETGGSGDMSPAVSIIRAAPVRVNIEREPVLDENNIEAATVEEQFGGFVIRVKFDRQGSWILERTTVMHRGRHLAIHSFFGENRWLAAPLITGKNSTGELVFTPDCTREEAERVVRGLNNTIRKMKGKENWPFPAAANP
jgi:preprotein translocase subunit SecD